MTTFTDLPDCELEVLRPAVVDGALLRRYGQDLLAWSPSSPRPAALHGVAATVFQILDGTGTVGDLVDDIHEVIGIPKPVARSQLCRVLEQLGDAGLLEGIGPAETWPTKVDLFPAPPNP